MTNLFCITLNHLQRATAMSRRQSICWCGVAIPIVALSLLLPGGCSRESAPPPPANANSAATNPTNEDNSELTLLPADFASWSRDLAVRNLHEDGKVQLAAAVRLAQLADANALLAPDEITDETVKLLTLRPLDDERFLFGARRSLNHDGLRAPVIIANDGAVTPLLTGIDEELGVFYESDDVDIFPHLLVMPDRVAVLRDEAEDAILLASANAACRFRCVDEDGSRRLELTATAAEGEPRTVARYNWDPYELLFVGPASDYLDEAQEQTFELDTAASVLLIPQGGIIPKPKEEPKPAEEEDGPRILDLNDRGTIPT